MGFEELLEVKNIIKFVIVSGLIVILPVWIFNLVEVSFFYKIMFTLAGFVGVAIALSGSTLRRRD